MNSFMTKTFTKYLRLGITPRPVRGNWKDGDYMYSIYHDNVQYAIDDFGDYEIDSDVSYILECLDARATIIKRNHEVVCEIYEFIRERLAADIWVRVGSGMQLNCTFGNNQGEIAHFMMDFIDPEKFEAAVEKIRKLIGDESGQIPDLKPVTNFVLMVSGSENVRMFRNFSHPLVEVLNLDDIEGPDDHTH